MITIKDWTIKDPLNCIGFFAGVCWDADTDSDTKNIKRALDCMLSGHGRVEELPDVYMIVDGYDAKCIREIYTHIGGDPTRLQASTRYINYTKGFNYITPPSVDKIDEAKNIWDDTMKFIAKQMNALTDLGIPNEDATNLLPLAYESKMVWKVNLRCLVNFMNLRLCSRAYWEIRKFAKELKKELSSYSPQWKFIVDNFFIPKCDVSGYCTEHKCCGRQKKQSKKLEYKI